MIKLLYLSCFLLLLAACTHQPGHQTAALKRDTVVVIVRDTVVMLPTAPPPPAPIVKQPATNPQLQGKPKAAPALAENDTTRYYYDTGKLSVKITPWNNSKRSVLFYNRQGVLTYRQEEVRMSYSVRAELHFRKNGSVESAQLHENPGASMYWYQSTITFSDSNEPEWQTSQRQPVESLTDGPDSYYWDKKTDTWIKQQAQP